VFHRIEDACVSQDRRCLCFSTSLTVMNTTKLKTNYDLTSNSVWPVKVDGYETFFC
jgi:hypothetical protein